jgi:hypothetical protein
MVVSKGTVLGVLGKIHWCEDRMTDLFFVDKGNES